MTVRGGRGKIVNFQKIHNVKTYHKNPKVEEGGMARVGLHKTFPLQAFKISCPAMRMRTGRGVPHHHGPLFQIYTLAFGPAVTFFLVSQICKQPNIPGIHPSALTSSLSQTPSFF